MAEENLKPLWAYTSFKDYKIPQKPATEKAKNVLSKLWASFSEDDKAVETVDVQTELKSIPQGILDWVAPFPDWKLPAKALYKELKSWAKSDSPTNIFKVFVTPPGGGAREILTQLAEQESWPTIKCPPLEDIVNGDLSWIDNISKSNESPLILPKLEDVFLRHHNGFKCLRKFIDTLFHYQQKCLVGCNSWLWKYLELSMEIENCFDEPITLQGFCESRLERLFCDLEKMNGKFTTVFRQTSNGEYVLPIRETADGPIDEELLDKDRTEPAPFLKKLAIESRGIPLVAWAIWRNSLNLAPNDNVEEKAKDAAILDKGQTIWVKPFEQLSFPKIPSGMKQKACFILLYLLLQDGVTSDVLCQLLQFERDDLLGIIQSLRECGIIVEERGLWRVTWLSYPEVRRFLAEEDYIIDAL